MPDFFGAAQFGDGEPSVIGYSADKSDRDGKDVQPRNTIVHRSHVVDDFLGVLGTIGSEYFGLGIEDVLERTLRSFDLARKDRFLADVHKDEQVGIGQRLDRAIQSSQGAIRLGREVPVARRRD